MNLVPPWSGCRGYRVKSLATAVLLVLAAAHVQPALMAQTPAPVIEKLKPASGPVGTNVKIKGSNFGTSGTVTFNGTAASPTSWESDKIQVKVPEGATTGPVVVTVGTQSSAGVTFTVTSAPSGPIISKLKPDSGPVGTEIKIKGLNFGEEEGTVTFNGLSALEIRGWNDKKVRAVVPAGATDGPVVVTTAGGQQSNGVAFDVTDGVPIISKLDPDSGPVLTQVKIKGTNFGDQEGTVTFNGVMASASQWNHEIIRTQVPQGATTGPVVVTVGNRSSNGVTFTVTESDSEPDPDDPEPGNPSDFSSSDLTGTSFTLNGTRLDGSAERVTVLFREGNRFEAAGSRTGSYDYRPTGPSAGTLTLEYDGGGSCEVELAFDSVNSGASSFECSTGGGGGRFRLTAGTTFVPVILTAAGRNDSFFTSEMTLTNRGTREARLHYTYTAHIGRGTGLHLRGASGGASAGGVGCARPPQKPGNPHSRRGEPHRDAEGGGSGRLPGGGAGPDHHGRPRRARRPGLPRYRDGGGIPAGRLPVRTAPEHTGPFQRGLPEHGRPGRGPHHLEDNRVLRRPQRRGAPGPAGGKAGTGRIPPVFGSVGQPRQRLREGGASQGNRALLRLRRHQRPGQLGRLLRLPGRGELSRGGPRDRPCR